MTVYVDDMFRYPMGEFKRGPRTYKMSHMIADTEAELHDMALAIGLARKWYQGNHYDVTMSARARAIAIGAVEITLKQCAAMAALRRRGHEMGSPETAEERRSSIRPAPLNTPTSQG